MNPKSSILQFHTKRSLQSAGDILKTNDFLSKIPSKDTDYWHVESPTPSVSLTAKWKLNDINLTDFSKDEEPGKQVNNIMEECTKTKRTHKGNWPLLKNKRQKKKEIASIDSNEHVGSLGLINTTTTGCADDVATGNDVIPDWQNNIFKSTEKWMFVQRNKGLYTYISLENGLLYAFTKREEKPLYLHALTKVLYG